MTRPSLPLSALILALVVGVGVSAGVTVSWKYLWNGAGNLFYFDHLKVTW